MDLGNNIFQVKEILQPEYTLCSFGYINKISPDGNTLVVIDGENSFIYIYNRQTINLNTSPFIFSNQIPKPEFKYQYIYSDIVFNNTSDQFYVSLKFCDYVNYDMDIGRNKFLISGLVFYKSLTKVPLVLENTTVFEDKISWSYFIGLPTSNLDIGYEKIFLYDKYLFGLDRIQTFGSKEVKIYKQDLDLINQAIINKSSDRLLITPPEIIGKISDSNLIKFYSFDDKFGLIYRKQSNRNIYKIEITNFTLNSEILFSQDKIVDFDIQNNQVLYLDDDKVLKVIKIEDGQSIFEIQNLIFDDPVSNIFFLNQGNYLYLSKTKNQIIISGRVNYTYENTFPFGDNISFDNNIQSLVIGQPKKGKVLCFIYLDEKWTKSQEIENFGFGTQFDLDSNEKFLVVNHKNDFSTFVYENISSDFTNVNQEIIDIKYDISSVPYDYIFEYMNLGFKNVVTSQILLNQQNLENFRSNAFLYQNIPVHVTKDGNIVFYLFQENMSGNQIRYHIYGLELTNQKVSTKLKYYFLTQSLSSPIQRICSNRTGDLIYILFENNSLDIYSKFFLNETEEIYKIVEPRYGNIGSLWGNGSKIDLMTCNDRGSILIFQQESTIVVLNYIQEPIIKLNLVGNELFPDKTQFGFTYKYFSNRYSILSTPRITIILNQIFLVIDDKYDIYSFQNNKINVYKEDNYYGTPYLSYDFVRPIIFNQIKIYPKQNIILYTYNNKLEIYYIQLVTKSIQNLDNLSFVGSDYHLAENNLLVYTNNQLFIYQYSISVSSNFESSISLEIIYQNIINIPNSYQPVYSNIDFRNNFRLLFLSNNLQKTKLYKFSPNSDLQSKYKLIYTYRQQKIDLDIQFKNEEFYNNVIKLLPKNYFLNPSLLSSSNNKAYQSGNQFKIICPQIIDINGFNFSESLVEKEIFLNFNSSIYYDNEVLASTYYDTKSYTNLYSVLSYFNRINDTRSLDLFQINKKNYIGLKMKLVGGKSVQYKFNIKNNSSDLSSLDSSFNLFLSKRYDELNKNDIVTSRGIKYPVLGLPNIEYGYPIDSEFNISQNTGIYKILDQYLDSFQIEYQVIQLEDVITVQDPVEIKLYIITELEVNIQTEENIGFNSNTKNTNSTEYGKIAEISNDGSLLLIGAEMDTYSSVIPNQTKEKEFLIWTEQTFNPPEFDRYTLITDDTDNTRWYNFEPDYYEYSLNYDINFYDNNRYDSDLNYFIDLKTLKTINAVEDYMKKINTYYNKNIFDYQFEPYVALYVTNIYGSFGRTIQWTVNDRVLLKTQLLYSENQNDATKSHSSPYNYDAESNQISGKSPKGQSLEGIYLDYAVTREKWNSLRYNVVSKANISSAHTSWANDITLSYVVHLRIKLSEEYFQRYHYNVLNYGCLFNLVQYNSRWRHLNTLSYKNDPKKPLRPSTCLIKNKVDTVQILDQSNFINYSNKSNPLAIQSKLAQQIQNNNISLNNKYVERDFSNDFKIKVEINGEFNYSLWGEYLFVDNVYPPNYYYKNYPDKVFYTFDPKDLIIGTGRIKDEDLIKIDSNRTKIYSYYNTSTAKYTQDLTDEPIYKSQYPEKTEFVENGKGKIYLKNNFDIIYNVNTSKILDIFNLFKNQIKIDYSLNKLTFSSEDHKYIFLNTGFFDRWFKSRLFNAFDETNSKITKISNDDYIIFNKKNYSDVLKYLDIIKPKVNYKFVSSYGTVNGKAVSDFVSYYYYFQEILNIAKMDIKITLPLFIAQRFNLSSETITISMDQNNILIPLISNKFFVNDINPDRKYFGKYYLKNKQNTKFLVGSTNKFEIYDSSYNPISVLKINDKIVYLFLDDQYIYNIYTDKNLIKRYKYELSSYPLVFDSSYNLNAIYNLNQGEVLFQDYSYDKFGKSFDIYQNKYCIIGTEEGKVVIQRLDKDQTSKTIINAGSKDYKNFASRIRSGKNIYLNLPERNKMYIINPIPYFQ
jgi:hypothetical protein